MHILFSEIQYFLQKSMDIFLIYTTQKGAESRARVLPGARGLPAVRYFYQKEILKVQTAYFNNFMGEQRFYVFADWNYTRQNALKVSRTGT